MLGFWYLYIVYAFVLTYLILGLIISFETTAAMSGGKFAVKWIKEHFSYKEFYFSIILFYPLLLLSYFFLEYLPSFLTCEIRCVFSLDSLFEELFNSK
ncbi:MAG: hypothetical protein COA44_11540 [Arcobacter sp.]|nr:MAG: hypothetical protein COA44_11540 [Arcobacter sp.]